MVIKSVRFFHRRLLSVTVVALLHLHNPAQAAHLNKLIPMPLMKKVQKNEDADTQARFNRWHELVNASHGWSENEKLKQVNQFFNKMKWVEDDKLWGMRDYWATPIESLMKNAGDCEDFSIAKYFTLIEMGVPEEKLSISYVKFRGDNQAHMVLTYYPDRNATPLVLDNAHKEILKTSERDDIVPVFHMNSSGVWRDGQPTEKLGTLEEVNEWKKMSVRMEREQRTDDLYDDLNYLSASR